MRPPHLPEKGSFGSSKSIILAYGLKTHKFIQFHWNRFNGKASMQCKKKAKNLWNRHGIAAIPEVFPSLNIFFTPRGSTTTESHARAKTLSLSNRQTSLAMSMSQWYIAYAFSTAQWPQQIYDR
jgi:hypothetical protein